MNTKADSELKHLISLPQGPAQSQMNSTYPPLRLQIREIETHLLYQPKGLYLRSRLF